MYLLRENMKKKILTKSLKKTKISNNILKYLTKIIQET